MGVVNLPGGKPTMRLTNGAAKRLAEMTPEGCRAVIHLTITDDFPLAQAFVIIEALLAQAARIKAWRRPFGRPIRRNWRCPAPPLPWPRKPLRHDRKSRTT